MASAASARKASAKKDSRQREHEITVTTSTMERLLDEVESEFRVMGDEGEQKEENRKAAVGKERGERGERSDRTPVKPEQAEPEVMGILQQPRSRKRMVRKLDIKLLASAGIPRETTAS